MENKETHTRTERHMIRRKTVTATESAWEKFLSLSKSSADQSVLIYRKYISNIRTIVKLIIIISTIYICYIYIRTL